MNSKCTPFTTAPFGPQAWTYWLVILMNVVIPQLLWFKKVRIKPQPLFFVAMVVLVGMWLERYMIIVTSLESGLPAFFLEQFCRRRYGITPRYTARLVCSSSCSFYLCVSCP